MLKDKNEPGLPERSAHLFEQIHEILWDKILNGEIEPAQRLRDREWAKRLEVSRTPVREAMRKMQQEGILLPLSQGGYEVRSVSNKDLQGLYSCRAALEALAAHQAAELTTPKSARALELIIEQTEKALAKEDLDRVFAGNSSFHGLIIDLSDNAHLKGLCEAIRKLILFYRATLLNKVKNELKDKGAYLERLRVKNEEHRNILDALRENDASLASKLMQDHLIESAMDMRVDG
ncbi:GntR family transcriptional regulator [Chelativorans xinjiangense]|uniref:GntR family transcriptional regulator n=1 Tax=Chelativorans xinjiangense TaxID=2681485 RepID=UPI0013589751|nr:GntR family transcriptional regulator [Chelativorans xinjiangense]